MWACCWIGQLPFAERHRKGQGAQVFFTLVFTGKNSLKEAQAPEISRKVYLKEDLPLEDEDQIRELLNKLGKHNSTAPNGIRSWMLRELCRVTARVLAFDRSWWSGKVSHAWKKGHFNSIICLSDIFLQGSLLCPGSGRASSIDFILITKEADGLDSQWSASNQDPSFNRVLDCWKTKSVVCSLLHNWTVWKTGFHPLQRIRIWIVFSFPRINLIWKVSKLNKVGSSIPFVSLMKFPPES